MTYDDDPAQRCIVGCAIATPTGARTATRHGVTAEHLTDPRTEPMNTTSEARATEEVSIEEVTPERAARWLLKRDHNPRHPSDHTVQVYARDMLAGNWHLGPGDIGFDRCGCLVKGQHTCLAVVASGVTIRSKIMRGMSDEAVRAIDRNKPRTVGQILGGGPDGIPNASGVGGALRTLWLWERGLILSRGGYSNASIDELLEHLAAHPGIIDAVRTATSTLKLHKSPLKYRTSVAAPMLYVARTLCPDDADFFFDRLSSGVGLEQGSAILAFRSWLLRVAASPTNPSSSLTWDDVMLNEFVDDETMHAISIKAWNYYIEGRDVRALSWKRGGSVNEAFPTMKGRDGATWPSGN